jgi:hypothetical protein
VATAKRCSFCCAASNQCCTATYAPSLAHPPRTTSCRTFSSSCTASWGRSTHRELFRAWCYRIACRAAFRYLRKEKRWAEQARDESALGDVAPSEWNTVDTGIQRRSGKRATGSFRNASRSMSPARDRLRRKLSRISAKPWNYISNYQSQHPRRSCDRLKSKLARLKPLPFREIRRRLEAAGF